jgi:hypothetical protein
MGSGKPKIQTPLFHRSGFFLLAWISFCHLIQEVFLLQLLAVRFEIVRGREISGELNRSRVLMKSRKFLEAFLRRLIFERRAQERGLYGSAIERRVIFHGISPGADGRVGQFAM